MMESQAAEVTATPKLFGTSTGLPGQHAEGARGAGNAVVQALGGGFSCSELSPSPEMAAPLMSQWAEGPVVQCKGGSTGVPQTAQQGIRSQPFQGAR